VHVVWQDNRDGNDETYYKRSTDGGATWGSDTRLTNDDSSSVQPSIAVAGAAVHVVWNDDRDGNSEIYYKRSTDGGATWGSDTRLTSNAANSLYPSVAVAGAAVHVVWHDDRDGNYEIYYKRSTTSGATWSSDTRLTNDTGDSYSPSVAVSGAAVHVVWRDDRDGNYEIYYKRDPTGNPAPTVTVTAPNGGEVWSVGSTRSINWAHGGGVADRDSIWYSTNNGSTWSFVAEKYPAATTHSWLVPNPPTTQALVKVKAVNQFGSTTDQSDAVFTIGTTGQPGWYSKSPMPTGAKAIKDGGWLAYDASKARVYASRGNKRLDFFAYAPDGDSWKALAPWLLGTEGKPPTKGSVGCADGSGIIYATKGNNKQGFYKYDATANAWVQKRDVPLGLSNKKVKGGTDVVWAYKGSTGSPYLLKGYKNEFYRYDVNVDSWKTLSPAPVGSSMRYNPGSWLAYDDVNRRIYAFKAKYHEFYSYNIDKDSWSAALTPMPRAGSAGTKKAKDGSCGTYTGGSVYALKGGNTWEFWKYSIASNSWAEKEQIPLGVNKKKVKAGADIVTAVGALYATKGNKTDELWMYVPGGFLFEAPRHDGMVAGKTVIAQGMSISPNPPAGGFAALRYSLPKAGAAELSVYDVAGQRVVAQALAAGRNGIVNLDLRHLSNGVYLVKLTAEGFAATQKLVVQR
jgi:hypothetical protein